MWLSSEGPSVLMWLELELTLALGDSPPPLSITQLLLLQGGDRSL